MGNPDGGPLVRNTRGPLMATQDGTPWEEPLGWGPYGRTSYGGLFWGPLEKDPGVYRADLGTSS